MYTKITFVHLSSNEQSLFSSAANFLEQNSCFWLESKAKV